MADPQKSTVQVQQRPISYDEAYNGSDYLRAQGIKPLKEMGFDKNVNISRATDGQGITIKLDGDLGKAFAETQQKPGLLGGFGGFGKKKQQQQQAASDQNALGIAAVFGTNSTVGDKDSRGTQEVGASSNDAQKILKLGGALGIGPAKDHFVYIGSDRQPLSASDLKYLQAHVEVINDLARGNREQAQADFAKANTAAAGEDAGTSNPQKLAVIGNLNTQMDTFTSKEPAGTKTLHFRADGDGNISTKLDATGTQRVDAMLQNMSQEQLFGSNQITYSKDAEGNGVVKVSDTISPTQIANSGGLKLAVDGATAKEIQAWQSHKDGSDIQQLDKNQHDIRKIFNKDGNVASIQYDGDREVSAPSPAVKTVAQTQDVNPLVIRKTAAIG